MRREYGTVLSAYIKNVMAANLIESIQKSLGYPSLQKVDPNSHEIKNDAGRSDEEKLGQAAIPAVLTAIYRLSRSTEGSQYILSVPGKGNKLDKLFGEKKKEAVEKIAQYSGATAQTVEESMEEITDESIRLIKETAGTSATPEKIKTYMSNQRHHILVYLPAALQLGDLLNDESLDDRTNKMEGPVSGFLHRIENILSESDQSKYP